MLEFQFNYMSLLCHYTEEANGADKVVKRHPSLGNIDKQRALGGQNPSDRFRRRILPYLLLRRYPLRARNSRL